MKRSTSSTRVRALPFAAALSLILAVAFLLVSPQGRAFAQQILQYFSRADSNTLAVPTAGAVLTAAPDQPAAISNAPAPATPQPPVEEEGCGVVSSPRCGLNELQQMVDFPIQVPGELPAGLRFRGGTRYQSGVLLAYEGESLLYLAQTPASDDRNAAWKIGQDAAVEAVTIGDYPGEYVQGSWGGLVEDGSMPWQSGAHIQTLRWQAAGLQFALVYYPQRGSTAPLSMPLEDLLALAAGIHPLDAAGLPTEEAPLDMRQLEQQADFSLVQPAWLPQGFRLRRTSYSTAFHAACLYYDTGELDAVPPLVIAQSDWALPAIQDIRTVALYDGQPIETAMTVENVALSGAEGGQGVLVSTGLDVFKYCGSGQEYANRALLWRAGGRSYVLFSLFDGYDGRGFVTHLEMLRLAETLNGVSAPGAPSLDPERMYSAADAEQVVGQPVKAPRQMFSNLHLDHISLPGASTAAAQGYPPTILHILYTGQPAQSYGKERLSISIDLARAWTLEERALGGGYQDVTVQGQPALYRELCWQGVSPDSTGCSQEVIWVEGSIGYEIMAAFDTLAPRDRMLAIAEDLR